MFDYKVGERFGCVVDIGWIIGYSYVVYGSFFNGVIIVLFESNFIYLDVGKLIKIFKGYICMCLIKVYYKGFLIF